VTRRSLPAPVAVVLLASAAAALGAPGVPFWAPLGAAGAVLVRLGLDRFLPPAAVPASSAAVIVASLLAVVAATTPFAGGLGDDTTSRVLVGALGFQVVWALSPPPFGHPALLLFVALGETVLAASAWRGVPALVGVAAFAAAFVVALASLEESAASPPSEAGARRLRAIAPDRRPMRSLAVALPLLFLALPLSAAVTLVARSAAQDDVRREAGEGPAATKGARGEADAFEERRRLLDERDASRAFVSGARVDARLGFVEAVKRDDTPALLLTDLSGALPERTPTLVGLTYDVFAGDAWERSPAARRERDVPPDPARPGDFDLGPAAGPGPTRKLAVTDLRGSPRGHLFLWPGTERLHFDAAADPRLRVGVDGVAYATAGVP
jgi:hypothetical protein